jgi:hypothetical protein
MVHFGGKQMFWQEKRVGDERGQHRTGNDRGTRNEYCDCVMI